MQILKTISELRDFRTAFANKSIGYIPTMGALHDGHASLIQQARDENEVVIVSVFVNPTQFLAGEDLDKYPRDENNDIKVAKENGATAIFMPSADEIYSKESDEEVKVLAPARLAGVLEGACRPGHFDGVCTVLSKFFSLVRPTRAYFGKKDAQQLIIVEKMVKSLFFKTAIVPCEIKRASDGLALSSRNTYLNESELVDACKLYRALLKAKNAVSNGIKDAVAIKAEMAKVLEPLKVDYIAICDRELREIDSVVENESIILIAAFVGKTRLIDNLWL